uniref:HMG domain-containing protein 3 n=1 Tax=Monopterus albus TaxID=43700 RepID=UPI0009B343C9|nr:HMG domain-containing protein 3-like [Monopterus albus]
MECNASVVDQDHCYTLSFPVSHHSPLVSPETSNILSASQPEASSTDACSPDASFEAGTGSDNTMKLPSYGVRSLKVARCPHCSLRLYKKNLSAHIQRKHAGLKDITAASHLKNVCVDETRGIFAVQKVAHGFSVPIHVQRKTWGSHHQIRCGLEECHKYQLLALQSGLIYSLCEHIRSLDYCSQIAPEELLNVEVLEDLVSLHIVEESMMATCSLRQKAAEKDHVPFSVLVDLGGSTHQLCFSVHEPKMRSFSCFGRVVVTYNLIKDSWHCPCTNPHKSCPHKSIGKWHLFQIRKDLLPAPAQEISHSDFQYSATELERSVRYTYAEKKIPAALPAASTAPRALTNYPVCLIPTEETCKLCAGHPRLEEGFLITDKAAIVGMSGVKHNISTYNKRCPKCHMHYRYQEWRDGLHNFNDHVILTIELCVYMRHSLQSHVSVSRVISSLASFRGQKFPAVSIIFQAYCHFEALTKAEYSYSCVNCGHFPAVVIMDLHRNSLSKLEVSELKKLPEDFDGHHDIEDFWDSVHLEMISQGFFPRSSPNPFVVCSCYEHWAPWIGKETRKSDNVLNTEFSKMPTSKTEGELSSVTADRLCDELLNQKEATLQSLCKSCGVETGGSRTDLIIRLREKLMNQQTYFSVYQTIWGGSGGWSVIACPHGIVYSLKFNLQTESPRDFADLLLSWKHFPNVCLYDSAHGLATHTNSRVPGSPLFHPHEGKPAPSTMENLAKAGCQELKVPLPWLKEKREPSGDDGHPVTGSSHHYALHDKLHHSNLKDPYDVLRRADIVPELQDLVKTKAVKHLFADMRKNNYFLNSMAPSTHVFLMRNLIEHRNMFCNTQLLET